MTPPGRPGAHVPRSRPAGCSPRQEAPAVGGDGPAVTSLRVRHRPPAADRHAAGRVEDHARRTTLADGWRASPAPAACGASATTPPAAQTVLEGPGDQKLETGYDGGLPVSLVASGSVPGTVALDYDDDFNLVSSRGRRRARAVAFGYDDDGLLTARGRADARRATPANGAPRRLDARRRVDRRARSTAADAASVAASRPGRTTSRSTQVVTRDDGGRIVSERDRRQSVRVRVRRGRPAERGALAAATCVERYAYDANGNRVSEQRDGGAEIVATFDARDRLVSRGATTYTYTRNGDLRTKVRRPARRPTTTTRSAT